MPSAPTSEQILRTGTAFWASKTLLSAVELGVFSALAEGPADLAEASERLGLHARSARDFLDALVALGFLEREQGRYANTPEADHFLVRGKPTYIGGMLEMANARLYPAWGNLTESLRTGAPANGANGEGKSEFDALYAKPERLKQFLAAMTGISRAANERIAQSLPWEQWRTFVDVGTAQGDLAARIALAHPHLRGIGFDLPPVRPVFEEYAAGLGLAGRLEFVAGDFFQDALPAADVVLMGHILHDWDLPTKRMLVRKAHEALPAGGAFVVYDSLIDDDRSQNAFGLLMSLNMLIETRGGFDYTGADGRGWLEEAGFREVRVEHLVGPDSMVVGIK